MTRKLFHLCLLGVVLLAGVATYAVCRNLAPAHGEPLNCMRRWLTLSSAQWHGTYQAGTWSRQWYGDATPLAAWSKRINFGSDLD